jgi:predicted nucleic acid-binding protein
MLTLDANIWIAAYDPRDPFHDSSVAFLVSITKRRLQLYAPAFMLVEAAARCHDGHKMQRLGKPPWSDCALTCYLCCTH